MFSDPDKTVLIEEQVACVSTISVKLPLFLPTDPHLWFVQVEVQMTINGVTAQETKFDFTFPGIPNSSS